MAAPTHAMLQAAAAAAQLISPLREADREVIQHVCERIGRLTKGEVDSGGGDATNAK